MRLNYNQWFIVRQILASSGLNIHLSSVDVATVGVAQEALLDTLLNSCCHIHEHLHNSRAQSVNPTCQASATPDLMFVHHNTPE